MAVTAANLIRTSMQDLGVLGAGEAADGSHMADGLRRLQLLISGWALDPLTVVQTERVVFPTTSGKGTYTIGPGMDLDFVRPMSQSSIVGAGLVLNAGQPNEIEIPRTMMTYDAYQGLRVKTLTSGQFTSVFYRPGSDARTTTPTPHPYDIEVGDVILWPVPTDANPLVLYIQWFLPMFENLTTSYPVPDGYLAALQHNLTLAMAPMFQVDPPAYVVRTAAHTLAAMKRQNYQFTDAPLDPMFTFGSGAGYDIESGGTVRRG